MSASSAVRAEQPTLASILRVIDRPLLPISIVALVIGGAAVISGNSGAGDAVWTALTIVVAIRLVVEIVNAIRHGQVGVDVIAVLAMIGSVLLHESLPVAAAARERRGSRLMPHPIYQVAAPGPLGVTCLLYTSDAADE